MTESGAPFAHLHVHTEYSMLDGAARLKDLFAEVDSLGMTHVAMTDHGNMFGAAEFHRQAKEAGITPVIGIEAYVAPEARGNPNRILWGQPHQKKEDVSAGGAYLHKTIWARNSEGLHNLFRLSSRSYAEGMLAKWPRMDKEILAAHSAGLMASTGCPSGELQTRLRLGQFDEALASAAEWQDIFGKENYFLELMEHGLDIERRVREGLIEIGRRLGIPPVVTNDSHYTREPDAQAHDMLLCIQTGKTLADADRFRFEGTGYYIKPAAEMYALDQSDLWQEGCRNSQLLIADRVDSSGMFEFVNLMPRFPLPDGFESEDELFRTEVWKGMERRYPDGYDEPRRKQAEYEIEIICQMGFPAYFLVVADFIMWAKNNGVAVGPGRGSAAGSIVAYAMGITDLDPL
ncbi:MAG: PHP domain-containing protein, partial [Actinobacteria bacterium]|nr:PHP domain-containing protein [Actinomycetota bacterium]